MQELLGIYVSEFTVVEVNPYAVEGDDLIYRPNLSLVMEISVAILISY